MEKFMKYILPKLNKTYKYKLYSHNGDYPFNKKYIDIINDDKIDMIYAQNIDLPDNTSKVQLLPIGIARDMFEHGNINVLYETIINTYKNKKTKNIYVNVNEDTHPLRKSVMDKLRKNNSKWEINKAGIPFKDYLNELSKYRFCLCLRGNGLDTHRFWESLYLGVIPVIYECEELQSMINMLKKKNIPFYIMTDDDIIKGQEYFNEKLKNDILSNFHINSIQCITALKISDYC